MGVSLTRSPGELRTLFFLLKSQRDVAILLEVPFKQLMYHARGMQPAAKYTEFNIAKKSGSPRSIASPATALKILQRKLNLVLAAVYQPRPCVHGFTARKNIVTNAKVHLRANFVFNVDLKDFFPTINFGRVRGMFMATPYGLRSDVATLLAQLTCHKNALPQGAPTSPIIANMICARMDGKLQRLAQQFNCRYSRYADDLTFSTTMKRFPKPIARFGAGPGGEELEIGPDLRKIIMAEGFTPNLDKIRLQAKYLRQEITGLTVNLFPNVERRYVSQLRAMLHAWRKFGYDLAEQEFREKHDRKHRHPSLPEPSFKRVVRGKIGFLGMVRGQDDAVYIRFLREYHALNPTFDLKIQVGPAARLSTIREALWVLETAADTKDGLVVVQGTAFSLANVGIVTCAHVVYDQTEAFRANDHLKRYPIKLIASDNTIDLAIIQINAPAQIQFVKGDSSELHEGQSITVHGYPNYNIGDQGLVNAGVVTGYRNKSGVRRMLVDAHIIQGNSGGPVLDESNRVVGVAVTGADAHSNTANTEDYGVIPIEALQHLTAQLAASAP